MAKSNNELTVRERELSEAGMFLLETCRRQFRHYRAILKPDANGNITVCIGPLGSDDTLRVNIQSTLAYSDRARRFGILGLAPQDCQRDGTGIPIALGKKSNPAYLPTEEYLRGIEACYGKANAIDKYTVWYLPHQIVTKARSGKITPERAVNLFGEALQNFCSEGGYEPM